jgi:hypothetical protein
MVVDVLVVVVVIVVVMDIVGKPLKQLADIASILQQRAEHVQVVCNRGRVEIAISSCRTEKSFRHVYDLNADTFLYSLKMGHFELSIM